jgi:calcineurin-like phosphoesterase
MKKCDDLFQAASQLKNLVQLRKDADFIIVDVHGEITSEKMALGHFFDWRSNSCCWNTYPRSYI